MKTPSQNLQTIADRGLLAGVSLPAKTGESRKLVRQKLEEMGCDPFETLALIAMGREVFGMMPELADVKDAAKELCNYLAPKLKAIEHVETAKIPGGVMMVPMVGSMAEWQQIVENSRIKTIDATVANA